MTAQPTVRTVVATPDPPPSGIPNPIHADDGAAAAGYRGALVAGVRTYGWVVEAVVDTLGPGWVAHGWADVTLRRPLFAGETVTIVLTPAGDDVWSVQARVEADDRLVLDGTVGGATAADTAPFADELDPPDPAPAQEPPAVRSVYTLDDAPVGQPLRPLGVHVSPTAALRVATQELGQPRSAVPEGTIHPWFLAARMAPLTRHNFTYGPTIHVRTQIQHIAAAPAGHDVVIGARIVGVHERNGHWYQVLDGIVHTGEGLVVARLRHHTIFRPRGTTPPPPIGADASSASGNL